MICILLNAHAKSWRINGSVSLPSFRVVSTSSQNSRSNRRYDVVDGTPLAASIGNPQVGDPLVITGSFVMHYTDTRPPVWALEWSVTPNRAMVTPEYHIEVTRFGVQPPAS